MEKVQSCGGCEAFSSQECEKLNYQVNHKCCIGLVWQGFWWGFFFWGGMQGAGI